MPPAPDTAADRRALCVLLAGACTIGCAPILVRWAEAGGAGPSAVGFWRLTAALPLLALLNRTRGGNGPGRPSRAALAAGVLLAVDLAFWHYGLRLTSVADATVLSNLTPILVTGVAWLLFKERPRAVFLLGLAGAVAGAAVMAAAHGGGSARPPAQAHLGDLLSALTALWYGGYFIFVREARRTAGAPAVMFWSSAAGAPVMLAAALLLREPLLPASSSGWLPLLALGLMHVVGQGAIAWALGRLAASLTSVVVLVQPVVAAALGWILFGEALGPAQAAGAALVLGGVVLAQSAARPRRAALPANEAAAPA